MLSFGDGYVLVDRQYAYSYNIAIPLTNAALAQQARRQRMPLWKTDPIKNPAIPAARRQKGEEHERTDGPLGRGAD
jgi:hypothetical protein